MYKLLYFFSAFVLLSGCRTTSIKTNIQPNIDKDPIEIAIDDATLKIKKRLRAAHISLRDKRLFFEAYGQIKNYDFKTSCDIFQKQQGYDYIKENITFGSSLVSAMVVDENGKYIVNCSLTFLSKRPEVYNKYPELKMIELAKENKYIAFVKIFNCGGDNFIGYKKGKVDVYRLVDGNLVFVYSK